MKKIIVGILIATSLFAAQVVELACDKGYPPYSYKDGKVAKGAYVDVIKAAFDKIPEYDVKFKAMAWKKVMTNARKGKVIGFFPPYFNKEREAWTKFSEPILPETTVVFAKDKVNNKKVKFPEDFLGLTVCMNRGFGLSTMGGDKFAKMVDSGSIDIKWGNNNKVCLNQVKKNKADFYINDQLIDTKKFPSIKRGLQAQKNNGYIGFTLKGNYSYKDDVRKKFNKVIVQMKKDGEVEKILKKYK